MYCLDMPHVLLVAPSWSKVIDVETDDDVIEAEGMSWEREGLHGTVGVRPADAPADLPVYVPSVGA
jgi:hypothetical protein